MYRVREHRLYTHTSRSLQLSNLHSGTVIGSLFLWAKMAASKASRLSFMSPSKSSSRRNLAMPLTEWSIPIPPRVGVKGHTALLEVVRQRSVGGLCFKHNWKTKFRKIPTLRWSPLDVTEGKPFPILNKCTHPISTDPWCYFEVYYNPSEESRSIYYSMGPPVEGSFLTSSGEPGHQFLLLPGVHSAGG